MIEEEKKENNIFDELNNFENVNIIQENNDQRFIAFEKNEEEI